MSKGRWKTVTELFKLSRGYCHKQKSKSRHGNNISDSETEIPPFLLKAETFQVCQVFE